ncbi:hypothetical protein F383_37405 [Gossypium arboreum]|uniref:Uncharacterized protein n=1 Tax=Gossypium arboreum TaxID=29729 RepID=A0A0B0MBE0_GOSAR|nr:hypothetical protein F383_37405 [Gossypium arboreum]
MLTNLFQLSYDVRKPHTNHRILICVFM